MIIIKIDSYNTFCMNGRIHKIDGLNVPKQFETVKDAKNYIDGYNDAISEAGKEPIFNYELIEL